METVIMKNNLTKLRHASNIDLQDFAKLVGVSSYTMLRFEAGNSIPTLKHAFRMSQVLRKPIEEIFSYKRMRMIEIE